MAFKRIEDRPSPKEIYSKYNLGGHLGLLITSGIIDARLYLLTLIAGWGGALFGWVVSILEYWVDIVTLILDCYRYDSAVVGGAIDLPVFRTQFGLDTMTPKQLEFVSSNIESTYQAGENSLVDSREKVT
jgi:hypothetical protein